MTDAGCKKTHIADNVKTPKIELHSHLEGTLTAETLIELARGGRERLLPSLDADELRKRLLAYDFKSFNGYMDLARPFRHKPQDVKIAAAREFARAAERGVIYAEYRFNFDRPLWDGIEIDELMDAIWGEIASAKERYGLETRLIFGMKRHENIAGVARMVRLGVDEFEKGRACGIDLNGDEKSFPVTMFRDCFGPAREAGCPLTLHAGEWDGPESVKNAVECGAARIGHGARSIEDSAVVEMLAEKKICLEICPTSNVCTGVYRSIEEHPARRLFDAGVRISINSDDHGAFGSDIAGEYAVAKTILGFNDIELRRINGYAIDAAFADEATKARLRNLI